MHHFGALTMSRAKTVCAGVTATQNHHPFALGINPLVGGYLLARQHPVLLGEVIHRQMNALQLTARNVQFPSLG